MTKCESNMSKILANEPNMGALEVAVTDKDYWQRLSASVRRARETGKYSSPQTREVFSIDKASKLVGTTITLESLDENRFVDVFVKNAEMINPNQVRINDGEYVLDYLTNSTRDGRYMLGSEKGFEGDFIKMIELSGTVKQDLDDYFARTVSLDGDKLSASHKTHLESIINKYKEVLSEAEQDVKIDVEFIKDLNEANNTRGEADPELGKIKLYLGNQANNTMSEILAHELQHVLIRKAIGKASELSYRILQMRDLLKVEFDKKYNGQGWKLFTEGKENANIEDAKKKWEYVFNSKKYPADEFLAYATTNEQMVKAIGAVKKLDKMQLLGEIDTKEVKLKGWQKVWNSIAKIVNQVYRSITTKGKGAKDLTIDLLDTALAQSFKLNEIHRKGKVDKLLDGITRLDKTVAAKTGAIKKEYKTFDEYSKAKENDKIKKIVESIWKIRGMAKVRSAMLQNNVFNSVTRNTDNPDIAKFYEMFSKSKAFVEREVVAVKNKTAAVLSEGFGLGKIDKELRKSSKRVLIDADVKSLGKVADIKKYLENPNLVSEEISKLDNEFPTVILAVDELAKLLVTNKTNMKNGYVNAAQIAFGELGTKEDGVVNKIDKFVTLRALQLLSKEDKANTLKALVSEEEGFDATLELLRTDEEKVLKEAYFGDKMYQVKGAKQEQFVTDKKHYLVREKEMKELAKSGMTNTGKHAELSRLVGEDIYVVIGDSTDVTYTEGLLSIIQLKNEGDSVKRLLVELANMTEREAETKIEELASEVGSITTEALIPERSGTGDIYDYKLRLSYETKADLMDMDNDIITTIAGTVSNLTHKQEAMLNNRASLIYFNKFYKDYRASKEFKFVEISEKSEGKFKEYWDLLPYYLKRQIEKDMNGKLMIEESLLTDYFGYQDVSLVNAPWIKNKVKRQVVAKKFESIIQEIAGRWKKVIVAFTPNTITGNMTSNAIIAMVHTSNKNPFVYAEKFKSIWRMMNTYQEDRAKKIELETRKAAGQNIAQSQIDGLEAKMRSNPVSIIIEDGQYNAILEDINTQFFDNKGILETKLDDTLNKIKREKTRERLKATIDLLYIRKNSKIHDSIMKLTTYSDAINKMIIVLDLQEQANTMKAQGKDNKFIGENLTIPATEQEMSNFFSDNKIPQSWLSTVKGLHVPYEYLDNRYVKYMNDMLFVSFTKYFFRVFPAMAKLLASKPLTVALVEGGRNVAGVGETPFEQFYNVFDSLTNKVKTFGDTGNVLETVLFSPFVK